MKIIKINHRSGLNLEAIDLFENDPFNNCIIFKNIDKPTHSIMEIDNRKGCEKEVDYDYLKTLTDDEIFNIFFTHK